MPLRICPTISNIKGPTQQYEITFLNYIKPQKSVKLFILIWTKENTA
jgi:hypothetical protein